MAIKVSDALVDEFWEQMRNSSVNTHTLTKRAIEHVLNEIIGEPVAWRVGNGGDVWMFRRRPGNGWRCEEPLYAIKQDAS